MRSVHTTKSFLPLFLLCVGLFCTSAWGQRYPEKPVKIVVPYPSGGFTDILARLLAEKLSSQLNQTVIVDNKGGGGSVIGSSFVAKSPPDGYTLLLVAPDLAINESLVADKLNYSASKDFAGVSLCAWSPLAMVVTSKLGVQKFSDFMELARKNPNTINFGSGGNGTGAHLALELFKSKSKLSIVHVPYKGNGPALTDLLGGQVSGMFLPYALAKPHIESHKLVILGTPGAHRSTAIPQIPTLAEQGIVGLDVQPWFGLVAPKLTPASTLEALNKEITTIMTSTDVRTKLKDLGAEATSSSPKEFDLFIMEEVKRWAQVVSDSGARAD
jgi:tripartite-type tricarboxylate transporter receptor subunit TctC